MIKYFKTIDLIRIISLFLILVIIRIPFLINNPPLIIPELKWMLIGERLAGDHMLYKHLWENIAPLSAYFYQFMHMLFGKSQLAYQIVSLIIIFLQALLFNSILIKNRVFKDNSLVPAFIYIILMNVFFDFNTIPPVLFSITFIMLAMGNLFGHIENKSAEDSMFMIGLNLGMAALFFFPAIFFCIPIIFATLLYTGTLLRKYLLLLMGVLLPLSFVWLYFMWNDASDELYLNMIHSFFVLDFTDYISFNTYFTLAFIPSLFLFLSFFVIYNFARYSSYQVRYLVSSFFMLVMAFFIWLIAREKSAFQMIIFIPFFVLFISHFFLLIQKMFLKISSVIFIGGILIINYTSFYSSGLNEEYVNYHALIVKETPFDGITRGKRILVLGVNPHIYNNSSLATPYLNWQLARLKFDNLNYYDNLSWIYTQFERDLPEVLIDLDQRVPQLFNLLPTIGELYRPGERDNVYLLK